MASFSRTIQSSCTWLFYWFYWAVLDAVSHERFNVFADLCVFFRWDRNHGTVLHLDLIAGQVLDLQYIDQIAAVRAVELFWKHLPDLFDQQTDADGSILGINIAEFAFAAAGIQDIFVADIEMCIRDRRQTGWWGSTPPGP